MESNSYKSESMGQVEKVEDLKKTPMTSLIMVINILVFLLVEFTGGTENTRHMLNVGASYVPKIVFDHEYYRLFTSMFLHFGMEHLANNMLVLFVLGGRLETAVGKWKFLFLYIAGGLFGSLLSCYVAWKRQEYAVCAGASGATFAIFGALLVLILCNKGHLEDLTIKKMLIALVLALSLGFSREGVDNMAHVGGMIGGALFTCMLYLAKMIRTSVP